MVKVPHVIACTARQLTADEPETYNDHWPFLDKRQPAIFKLMPFRLIEFSYKPIR